MTKRRAGVLISLMLVFILGGLAAIRSRDRLPVIEWAARFHSERGSIECGHVTNRQRHAEPVISADAGINCAIAAHENRRPFTLLFTGSGMDERVSTAIIGDSEGNVTELIYATGMVINNSTLLKHSCSRPVQLLVERRSPYGFPRLHCAPWPPERMERDYLLW